MRRLGDTEILKSEVEFISWTFIYRRVGYKETFLKQFSSALFIHNRLGESRTMYRVF